MSRLWFYFLLLAAVVVLASLDVGVVLVFDVHIPDAIVSIVFAFIIFLAVASAIAVLACCR